MKFMVQQRQWRRQHPDSHYATATFRYMREYALLLRNHCSFICVDDKHKVKVGEPGFAVASAERGRRVPVRSDEFFMVGIMISRSSHSYPLLSLLLIYLKKSVIHGIQVCEIITL